MATTALMPIHARGKSASSAIKDTINYVKNPDKTEKGEYISGYACHPYTADAEFMLSKREYINRTGRVRGKDDVIAYHLRQSFAPGEITPELANQIGMETAKRFTHGNNAFIVATHTDKHHIHNHIVFSAVTLDCERKFRNFWGSTKALRRLNDLICLEHGMSIVAQPRSHGRSYKNWLENRAAPSQRDSLREAIDTALQQHPRDIEAFIQLMQDAGWQVKRGKHLAFRRPIEQRFKRLDSLGEEYSLAQVQAVIQGKSKHISCFHSHKKLFEIQALQSLIDIQQNLKEGKGGGFVHWAGKFNTKQAAKALLRFSELGLQRIFKMAEDDMNVREIAEALTKERIINPSTYKTLNGDTRFVKHNLYRNEFQWCGVTIHKILTDRVYCGDMINHKCEVINYKTKERVRVPLDQRIIVKNTHEAIISEQQFARVQERLRSRAPGPRYQLDDPIKDYLFCSECGRPLSIASRKQASGVQVIMRCMYHYTHPEVCAHPHAANLTYIQRDVIRQVKEYLLSIPYEKWLEDAWRSEDFSRQQTSIIIAKKQIAQQLNIDQASIQEDKASSLKAELAAFEHKQQALEETVRLEIEQAIGKIKDMTQLPSYIIESLINRIEVGYRGEIEKDKVPIRVQFLSFQNATNKRESIFFIKESPISLLQIANSILDKED